MIKKGGKRGQVTIFIIIAILVIALAVLIYLYWPKLSSHIGTETKNPSTYIQDCMEETIKDTLASVSMQGGDYVTNEKNGYFYKAESETEGRYVKYLCYTNENFVHCMNQQPFLTEHVESEILNNINTSINNCFNSMEESYKTQGYDVNLQGGGNAEVSIVPNFVSVDFNRTLALVKGKDSSRYDHFDMNINSHLYDLLEVSKNILTWEMNAGDSLPEAYMYDNPKLTIQKHRKDNDVKVYVLKDKDTEEVFEFAVRSFATAPGYQLQN